jgi:acetyl esterase/lipase
MDCVRAAAWVRDQAVALGIDPARLAIAGDSAGGGLAAAACQILRDEPGPPIALQILLCPILDLAARSPSRIRLAEGHFLDEGAFARDLAVYCPGADLSDPRLSPLRCEDLVGLPGAIIHTAQFDPFADEGEAYGRRLTQAGVGVRLVRHGGMIHFFYAMPGAIPYAIPAVEALAKEVKNSLSASGKA